MIVSATVRYVDILNALNILDIPGVDLPHEEEIKLVDAEVDEGDIDFDCPYCDGEDEPAVAVNPMLIADFLKAVRTGDIHTAQALVARVFDAPDDVATVDRTLCRCAA